MKRRPHSNQSPGANTRAEAARVLAAVMQSGESLATALPASRTKLPSSEGPVLAELCFGCLRYGGELAWLCDSLLQKPLPSREYQVKVLLMAGIYQLRHMRVASHAVVNLSVDAARLLGKPWAAGLVNGVLRQYLRRQDELELTLQQQTEACTNHPVWLVNAFRAAWPAQVAGILANHSQQAGMTLRVNRLQQSREQYRQQLAETGLSARPSLIAPDALYLDQAVPVDRLPGFAEGRCSVQDTAAQLCAPLLALAAGQQVLDACAAPGGKTGHLLEITPDIDLLAIDQDPVRLKRVEENLDRLRLQARIVCGDAAHPAVRGSDTLFDRILLDAPCSGTGVIRRHPDIKWLRRPEDIPALAIRQRALLEALWPRLKPDGILLYTTCSILPEENTQVVAAFLQAHTDAICDPIDSQWGISQPCGKQLLPGMTEDEDHDGFYFARLRKAAR